MAILLAYAVVAGIAIAEWLRVAFRRIRVQQRLSQMQTTLRAFQAATGDDARQRLILQAGLRTLSLSSMLFVALAMACLVMAVPLPWISTSPSTITAYMVALTVTAFAWWRLR